MGKFTDKLISEKPWAWLRMSRAQYDKIKPWKKSGFSKEEFERIVLSLPQDAIESLHEEVRADMLIDALFKEKKGD